MKLVHKNPNERITAREALNHQWFRTDYENNLIDVHDHFRDISVETHSAKKNDDGLLTCTPVLAGRKLKPQDMS